MATSLEYIEEICNLLLGIGNIRYRKMFGEYVIYINDKPIITACDNICYIKKLDAIKDEMRSAELGFPYDGAKEHYVLDFSDVDFCRKIACKLEEITPLPKKRTKK